MSVRRFSLVAIALLTGVGCDSDSSHKDQFYGTDAAANYHPADGSLISDSSSTTDGTPVDAAVDRGADGLDAAEVAVTSGGACGTCEQQHIAGGDCVPGAGCDSLTGTDQNLCLTLVACIRRTGCWSSNVVDCLCGTATGAACASDQANGACRAEIQAATKSTDPAVNSMLMNSLSVPSGHATQLIVCDKNYCQADCLTSALADAGSD